LPSKEFKGPTQERQCRDVTFLVAFLILIAGMVGNMSDAF